jgi:glycosyltransferase involved in cell wall biosynthesis
MRLAIDAANLAVDRRGMGRYAHAIVAAAIADPSFEVTLLANGSADPALRERFAGPARFDVASPASARKKGRYDLCWFPFNGMRYEPKAPCVVTIHDAFAFSEPARGAIARRREQAPIRRAALRARRVVCDSAWACGEIAQRLQIGIERLSVVPLAPDPFFTPGTGDALPPSLEGKRFVLFVGGREARKNARVLFEAAARALQPGRETLVVVGDLADLDALRLRLYGVPHVRMRADDELLRSLYRRAAAVAVPSRAEGFGLVAVEAMACGAPVIAAAAGALPEATDGAAMLIDPDDPAAWATGLRKLLDDPEVRARYAAQSTVKWGFAARDGFVRRTLAIFRSVGYSG